jgi:hypothetical protein
MDVAAPLGQAEHNYNHVRQESAASASDVLAQPEVQAYSYPTARSPPPQRKLTREQSQRTAYTTPANYTTPYPQDYGRQHHG